MLATARTTDASTLRNLLSTFRDPSRREEAVSRSLDLAADWMKDQGPEEEVEAALDEPQAVEPAVEETPEEALAALRAVEMEAEQQPGDTGEKTDRDTDSPTESRPETEHEPPPPIDSRPVPQESQAPKPSVVDWSRWDAAVPVPRPAPTLRADERHTVSTAGPRRFGEVAAVTAVGVERSVLHRLRALQRALPDLADSGVEGLGELIDAFPDGWVRRRALSALIKAGIPQRASDAVKLVASTLDRELDRRWCLGVLARRGDLQGASLDQANELLSSPSARRRLAASVSHPRSAS